MPRKFDITKLAELLENQFHQIDVLYIFGSSKDGMIKDGSDIDIAVLLSDNSDKMLQFEIALAVDNAFKTNVDIVVLNSANPILIHEIIKTGNRLFERNSEKRAIFEVNAFKDYVDYSYFLRRRYAN